MNTPLKIAHRGYVNTHPENTIGSFLDAIVNGFDMIELDIQLCKDDQIIVLHDTYLGSNMVEELTLDEIRLFKPDVLSLLDFFQQFPYDTFPVYIDLKGKDELAAILCAFLKNNKICITNLYFASFNCNHLEYLSIYPLKLIYLSENKLDLSMIRYIVQIYDVSVFALSWMNVDEEIIHYIHSLNKRIFVYTVQNTVIMDYLKRLDLDGFVSDVLL
jgi:glycerophosphoryl diester phosphodiesterase